MARLMSIDYGDKRVGVAISDATGSIAQPEAVLFNDDTLIEALTRRAEQAGVSDIVIGESKNYAGEDNPIQRRTRTCAKALEQAGYTVHWHPEVLTSAEARRTRAVHGRKKRDTRPVDAQAAALLLQSYINEHRSSNHV